MTNPDPMQPYGSAEADARVWAAIKTIADLVTKGPTIPAVDLADIRVLFEEECGHGGGAVCGHGIASGPDRATKAAAAAMADLKTSLSHCAQGSGMTTSDDTPTLPVA